MPSFDVVSKIDKAELKNATEQAKKEYAQRYDFRGSDTELQVGDQSFTITSDSDERARSAYGVFVEKLAKRGVSAKHFEPGQPEPATGSRRKLVIKKTEGVEREQAKKIVAYLKDAKLKVQASVVEDTVRVTGKKRDDLQAAIAALKSHDFGIELQYNNFRD